MRKYACILVGLMALVGLMMSVGCEDENTIVVPEGEGNAPAGFVVEPDTLTIDDDGQPGILYLATFPPGEVAWRLAAKPEWIAVEPDSGIVGTQISDIAVICDEGLSPGVHHARLEFISTGGSADVDVFFNVGVHPRLAVADTLIAFPSGIDTEILILQSVGTGSVSWALAESATWLLASSTSGSIWPGNQTSVGLSVNRAGLVPGSYDTFITVSSNSENGDIVIHVTLEVAAEAILQLGSDSLNLGYFTDTDSVLVMNAGNFALEWTSEANQEFIVLAPGSGTIAPGDTTTVVVTVDRTGMVTGTHPATLTFWGPGEQQATVAVAVQHFVNELTGLGYRIVDAEYDRSHDVIVAVAASPNQLVIRDPETGVETAVPLSLVPTCVSIQPGGDFAAVGHDAYFSYVDLNAGTVLRTYAVTTNAVDIVLASNGYCYVFPRTDQWETIRCIQLTTGGETNSGGYSIYAGTVAKLHPSGEFIYGANNGLSPSDFEKYDIRSGTAAVMYDSPYHGDYAFSGDIWIADDGLRLFARSGNVFRSSTIQAEDMTYAGNLAGATYLEWVEHSTAADLVLALPASTYTATSTAEIRVYDSQYLALQGVRPLPQFIVPNGQGGGTLYQGFGQFVFINQVGDRFHALVKAEGNAGLLNDWAQYSGDVADLP